MRHKNSWMLHILLIALSVVFAFPLIWLVLTSLKPIDQTMHIPIIWWPREWQWGNYWKAFTFNREKLGYRRRCLRSLPPRHSCRDAPLRTTRAPSPPHHRPPRPRSTHPTPPENQRAAPHTRAPPVSGRLDSVGCRILPGRASARRRSLWQFFFFFFFFFFPWLDYVLLFVLCYILIKTLVNKSRVNEYQFKSILHF